MDQAIQDLNEELKSTNKESGEQNISTPDLFLKPNLVNSSTKNMPSFLSRYTMVKKTPLSNLTAKVELLLK